MRNCLHRAVTAALGAVLAFSVLPSAAFAEGEVSSDAIGGASSAVAAMNQDENLSDWHQSGTCVWNIVNGVLTVRPQDGYTTGTLGSSDTLWSNRDQIISAKVEGTVVANDCMSLFADCHNMQSIDLSGLDTSHATNMNFMFESCYALSQVDFSELNTSSVDQMSFMFMNCNSLRPEQVYKLDTSSVSDLSYMFQNCRFVYFDLSKLDTSSASNMTAMFYHCMYLKTLDLSGVTFKSDKSENNDIITDNFYLDKVIADENTKNFIFPGLGGNYSNFGPIWLNNGRWTDMNDATYSVGDVIPSKKATYRAQWDINENLFNIDLSAENYTGKPITKAITSNDFLPEDYSISYSNNVNPGTATITISGTSTRRIKGTLELHFTINGEGSWVHSAGGWWWRNGDGTYPTSSWKNIDGSWYWFNASGYMATGWQKISGSWYYFNGSGSMATGWRNIGGAWYLFDDSGIMLTGWQQVGGSWYYLNASGSMATGWLKLGGSWYYLDSSGIMATSWKFIGGKWYCFDTVSGAMIANEFLSDCDDSGLHAYYVDASGAMVTGWKHINGSWYYFMSSGLLATNRWVDTYYYVNESGQMVTNSRVDGYWVGSDGRWVPGV